MQGVGALLGSLYRNRKAVDAVLGFGKEHGDLLRAVEADVRLVEAGIRLQHAVGYLPEVGAACGKFRQFHAHDAAGAEFQRVIHRDSFRDVAHNAHGDVRALQRLIGGCVGVVDAAAEFPRLVGEAHHLAYQYAALSVHKLIAQLRLPERAPYPDEVSFCGEYLLHAATVLSAVGISGFAAEFLCPRGIVVLVQQLVVHSVEFRARQGAQEVPAEVEGLVHGAVLVEALI